MAPDRVAGNDAIKDALLARYLQALVGDGSNDDLVAGGRCCCCCHDRCRGHKQGQASAHVAWVFDTVYALEVGRRCPDVTRDVFQTLAEAPRAPRAAQRDAGCLADRPDDWRCRAGRAASRSPRGKRGMQPRRSSGLTGSAPPRCLETTWAMRFEAQRGGDNDGLKTHIRLGHDLVEAEEAAVFPDQRRGDCFGYVVEGLQGRPSSWRQSPNSRWCCTSAWRAAPHRSRH